MKIVALALLVLCAASSAAGAQSGPKAAADLAKKVSADITRLNTELATYAQAANDTRKEAAARIADGQIRATEDASANNAEIAVWNVAGDTKFVTAMKSLSAASEQEMASTESDIAATADAQNRLAIAYGKVAYDPAALNAVISSLQTLAGRDSTSAKLQVLYAFATDVVSDMKAQNKTAKATLDKSDTVASTAGAATKK